MKPNFLYIGPDKSGSSWMFEVFKAHPEMFVPECKDIYFFDRYYHKGMKWYLKFFEGAPRGAHAMGELSHDYLFSRPAASRISRDLPGVKLVTSLRNPAERSFSQYLYLVRSGMTKLPFEDALEEFPQLIENSLYHKHLSVYMDYFDRSQLKVLFFEKLVRSPREYASELFSFLELPLLDGLPYHVRVRPASRPRNYYLAYIAKKSAMLVRDLGFASTVGMVKDSAIAKLLYEPYNTKNKPKMKASTRDYLKSVFEKDILRLGELLASDFTEWLAGSRQAA